MLGARILAVSLLTAGMALAGASAFAQQGPNYLDPQRDCQTVTTCRFTKGGSYRGCLSSYSCRVCRFVSASCDIAGRGKRCQRLRCFWGA
jgi:hypothetical protein